MKQSIIGAALAVALGIGFGLGYVARDSVDDAHAQPRRAAKRLISIAVEGGMVFKAYSDESIQVCQSEPTGVSCQPFQ